MPHATTTQVSALLHRHAALSGEALASHIHVTRAAVHKAVGVLRRKGFVIQGTAGSGYALTSVPDLLCEEAVLPLLPDGTLGVAGLVHLPTIGSTNAHAAALARDGAPHGTVVLAEHQSAGRGRRGRSFASPERTGIYLSAILRPPLAPRHAYRLTLCGALAVLDVMQAHGIAAGLKWPNDVLTGGRKLCGILTELSADAERIQQAIIGIGVNVNTPASAFPAELGDVATSMSIVKKAVLPRVRICGALLVRLTAWYEQTLRDWPGVVQRAREQSLTLGRGVKVRDGTDELTGRAVDLDEEGALVLETAGGLTRVVAGDVEFLDPPAGRR